MNAREGLRIELLFERGQRLAQQVLLRPGVKRHVVIGRLHPVDVRPVDQDDALAGADRDPCRTTGLRAKMIEQRIEPVVALVALEPFARTRQRHAKPIARERLQQIVDRMDVEGLQRVPIERGDEHDRGQVRRLRRPYDLEPIQFGHLHVEECDVRPLAGDRLDR